MIEKNDKARSMSELADAAFEATAQQVLSRARGTGTDILVWRDNRIVSINPDDFEAERKTNGEDSRDKQ